jgi:hypothetical protein
MANNGAPTTFATASKRVAYFHHLTPCLQTAKLGEFASLCAPGMTGHVNRWRQPFNRTNDIGLFVDSR